MVCAYVREDNPRALANVLSPVHTQYHTITALLHQHALHFVYCEVFDAEHWNIAQRGKLLFINIRSTKTTIYRQKIEDLK